MLRGCRPANDPRRSSASSSRSMPYRRAGTAIDTAARLAARWRVPLHGVFIEDEELIGLAGLPFARQVTLGARGLDR